MKANCKLPAQLHELGKWTAISELKWLKPLAIQRATIVPFKSKRYFVYAPPRIRIQISTLDQQGSYMCLVWIAANNNKCFPRQHYLLHFITDTVCVYYAVWSHFMLNVPIIKADFLLLLRLSTVSWFPSVLNVNLPTLTEGKTEKYGNLNKNAVSNMWENWT